MKFISKKGMFVALSALACGLTAAGCSFNGSGESGSTTASADDESTGSLGLNLTLSNGAEVVAVQAVVSGGGLASPIVRTIPVPGANSTVSAVFGGLPAGDYNIALTASSTDGTTACSGSAAFTIVAGGTVGVVVPMTCNSDVVRGTVRVNGELNVCPGVSFLYVAPLQTDVGLQMVVEASAVDPDGDPITFAWTATDGSFVNPAVGETAYNCSAPGDQTLTLTINDGGSCSTATDIAVRCEPTAVCGDGTAEADKGEECDPPVPGLCSATCQTIDVVCGDGLVQPGEECDSPDRAECNASCQLVECGDGVVEGPFEQCEPPGTPRGLGNCDDECRRIPSVCGNSIVEPGEQCDNPADPACNADSTANSDLCGLCSDANCPAPSADFTARCTGTTCDAYLACQEASGCDATDVRDCYCGVTPYSSCFLFDANAPKGPCKDIINGMAGSTTPLQVGTSFFDGTTPLGAVNNLSVCQASSCSAECN